MDDGCGEETVGLNDCCVLGCICGRSGEVWMSGCTLEVRCCTSVVSRATICPCCSISWDTEKEKNGLNCLYVYIMQMIQNAMAKN